jgi:hypothetical protein
MKRLFLILATVTLMLSAMSAQTYLGPVNVKSQNRRCFASKYLPGSDLGAKINAVVADTLCSGIDTSDITTAQTISTTPTISRAMTWDVGPLTATCTVLPCLNVTSGGVVVNGDLSNSITVSPAATSTTPAINVDFSATTQAKNIDIHGLHLIGGDNTFAKVARRPILVNNVTGLNISNNLIEGFDLPVAGSGDILAIDLVSNVTKFKVNGNTINFPQAAAATDLTFRVGILASSPLADQYNGLVSAGVTPLPVTTKTGDIADNTVTNGTHGVDVQNANDIHIHGNHLYSQGHRNIIIYATSDSINVNDNYGYNAGSCNLIADYGITNLHIVGNHFDTTRGGEGRNIELYEGVYTAEISGNTLNGANTNAVYMGYGISNVNVVGNQITAAASQAIQVENTQASAYTTLLAGGGLTNINVSGNNIKANAGTYAFELIGITPGTIQGSPAVNNVNFTGNTTTGGIGGVYLNKNGFAGTWTNVNVAGNIVSGFTGYPYQSDYQQVFNFGNYLCSASPATLFNSQPFAVGSICFNSAPAVGGGPLGWVNTTAGTPGVWSPFGFMQTSTGTWQIVTNMSGSGFEYGFQVVGIGDSTATSETVGVISRAQTAAAAYNTTYLFAFEGQANSGGAGSSATNSGVTLCQGQSFGTNKWCIYSITDPSYFAGSTIGSFGFKGAAVTGTGTAGFVAGAAAGTSPGTPTCTTSHICDSISGTISFTMGTATTTGIVLTVTTSATRTNQGNCIAHMKLAASPYTEVPIRPTETATTVVFNAGTAPTASTAYELTYACPGS